MHKISEKTHSSSDDEYLFGWDPTPGIVSVWANREGLAIIWKREGERIISTREYFRPWIFAYSLDDFSHLGSRLVPNSEPTMDTSTFTYRELDGPTESYRYLVTANNGRLQFDLETTALDPHRGRIFMVAIRDNRGLSTLIEAPTPEDEINVISNLCSLIRERELIDTLDAVRRHDFVVRDMPSYSLKDVAKYFNIASPNRVYLDGATIFETYQREPARVRHYALDNVTEVKV